MTPESQQIDQARLRISEIFYSLQGESLTMGVPTVFIRLTGCPLRCGYCDTEYAFHGGRWMTIADILNETAKHQTHYVTVTGGEPLAQKPCIALLQSLCDAGYEVSLETSGALPVADVDNRVIKVMDIKTPGSGEVQRNRFDNFQYLNHRDQIKFVICDRHDYDWAKEQLTGYQLPDKCEILFSPSFGQMDSTQLAEWILQDHLPVRFQLQLHKRLWGEEPGR